MSSTGPTPREFRLGTVAGVPVVVRASWLLVAALIAWVTAPHAEAAAPGLGPLAYVAGAAFAVLLYLSVLVHEAAHAVMARRLGIPVLAIRLEFLGGATQMGAAATRPAHEFLVAVVGPVASLLVGGLAYAVAVLAQPTGLVGLAVYGLTAANLFVGAFNLLPGYPLDGGKVLRAGVWQLTGDPDRGTVAAAWTGRALAALLLLAPWALRQLGAPVGFTDYLIAAVVAAYVWSSSSAVLAYTRIRSRLPRLDPMALARPVRAVPDTATVADLQGLGEPGDGVVLVDPDGRPTAMVDETALAAVPEERRAWVSARSVSRAWHESLALPVDVDGEALLRTLATGDAPAYVLVDPDGRARGVLRSADVEEALRTATGPAKGDRP